MNWDIMVSRTLCLMLAITAVGLPGPGEAVKKSEPRPLGSGPSDESPLAYARGSAFFHPERKDPSASLTATKGSPETIRLFNGHNLDGWYTYVAEKGKNNDPEKIFQVHDGAIHIYKDAEEGAKMPFGYVAAEAE
ncbi:MAG TPA: hypothetical protein VGQ81_07900, partial [Acidobacteriota bacterium]|nr:hypothetical protein [Acidobacteriota bacterium]